MINCRSRDSASDNVQGIGGYLREEATIPNGKDVFSLAIVKHISPNIS
tara:strand:- start:102 stop:245 length:144 start_codon:yes stop_codon:yes gene_type:complete